MRSLLSKKGRRQRQLYLAEGIRLLEESLRHDIRPQIVYYAPSMLSQRGERLISRYERLGVTTESLPARQITVLSETDSPQGAIGVFVKPRLILNELPLENCSNILVCENISDPGNLGTLLRSALAFDFTMVILSGNCAEPWLPKVVRSSAGSLFALQLVIASGAEVARFAKRNAALILAADVAGDVWRHKKSRRRRSMLLIGSEASGLSKPMLALAGKVVRINHRPDVESLNAAVAGSILMKQIYDTTMDS